MRSLIEEIVMIRIQRRGAFESPLGMLSEIDHALALIGTAH